MQKLRKLPFVLAILVTLFMTACTEVEVTPSTTDDDNPPVIPPPK